MENPQKTYVGIDISKGKFDFAFIKNEDKQIANKGKNKTNKVKYQKGEFQCIETDMMNFLTILPKNAHCVMEFTGTYHLKLLYFLNKNNINTSVIKGESSKYFSKMRGNITKNDKQDAILLSEYGQITQPEIFNIPEDELVYLKQKRTLLDQLIKQKNALKNNKEAFLQYPIMDKMTMEVLEDAIKKLEQSIEKIKKEIEKEITSKNEEDIKNLTTIPGVGKTTALNLLQAVATFQGFREQSNSKAFVKFVGLAPSSFESGTSVRKESHISKVSHTSLRKDLFLPALNFCKEKQKHTIFGKYYLSLRERGKSKKEAIVAVMHKIVRVMMAVLKSGKPFDESLYGKAPQKINSETK